RAPGHRLGRPARGRRDAAAHLRRAVGLARAAGLAPPGAALPPARHPASPRRQPGLAGPGATAGGTALRTPPADGIAPPARHGALPHAGQLGNLSAAPRRMAKSGPRPRRTRTMLILLDQDGVLADFEHAFLAAWRQRHPDIEPVAYEQRQSFRILEDYPPELRARAEAIYTAPGFIRDLPPVAGAIEAYRELTALGMDVRICSSPLHQFENCVAEKYLWVERHLGRAATERLILTRDKTLVRGDLLIDD